MGCSCSKSVDARLASQQKTMRALVSQNEQLQQELMVIQYEAFQVLEQQRSTDSEIVLFKNSLDRKMNNLHKTVHGIQQNVLVNHFELENNMSLFTKNTQEHKDNVVRLLQELHDMSVIPREHPPAQKQVQAECEQESFQGSSDENVQINQIYISWVVQNKAGKDLVT